MQREIERRSVAMRATEQDPKPGRVSGRAIVYGALSGDLGGFRERFMPGSVQLSDDVLVLHNHDTARVLGRQSAGTAVVRDDGTGIVFECEPPDTTWARDLARSMERGDIKQCSFAFFPVRDEFYYDAELGTVVREVYEAQVSELSIVSLPAYPATSAAMV